MTTTKQLGVTKRQWFRILEKNWSHEGTGFSHNRKDGDNPKLSVCVGSHLIQGQHSTWGRCIHSSKAGDPFALAIAVNRWKQKRRAELDPLFLQQKNGNFGR